MARSAHWRVPGHELEFEGAPHSDSGYLRNNWRHGGVGGEGCARCSCGAMSDVLASGAARRRWHRGHKRDVLDARCARRGWQTDGEDT